jgi:hypothetical protein
MKVVILREKITDVRSALPVYLSDVSIPEIQTRKRKS